MTTLSLGRGKSALIDDEDAALGCYRWCFNGIYAMRKSDNRTVYLHRELCELKHGDKRVVDHINKDTLDNRRCNLRVVSHAENMQNQKAHGGTSTVRGVSFYARTGRWRAQAMVAGQQQHLGYFETEDEAAVVASNYRAAHMPFAMEAA